MPQIEQRTLPLFRFVGTDDARLGVAAGQDGAAAGRGVPGQHGGTIAFQPIEEIGHVDDAVFHDLGIAGPQFAGGQGVEHACIGENQTRLIESAHQVLALGCVDGGLAADR